MVRQDAKSAPTTATIVHPINRVFEGVVTSTGASPESPSRWIVRERPHRRALCSNGPRATAGKRRSAMLISMGSRIGLTVHDAKFDAKFLILQGPRSVFQHALR
jgi:hypothetical protein